MICICFNDCMCCIALCVLERKRVKTVWYWLVFALVPPSRYITVHAVSRVISNKKNRIIIEQITLFLPKSASFFLLHINPPYF